MRRIHLPESINRRLNSIGAVVILLHTAAFLAFWLGNAAFYTETNDYLVRMLGASLDYIRICLLLAGGLLVWSAWRLLRPTATPGWAGWVYAGLGLVFVLFFYGSFWMLFRESPVQQVRIWQWLGYHRVLYEGLAVLLLVGWLGGRFPQARLALGLAVLAAGVLALVFPPANVYRGALPAKPHLVAHRGAAALAPENTLASARLAMQLGSYALESDVRISLDGKLFLMHDDTLKRTTDVAQVFTERQDQRGESFTWKELSLLDAGSWFLAADPFGSLRRGQVTPQQQAAYRGEPVATLESWLALLPASQQFFIFDLKAPPQDHPYREQFFTLAFDQIHAAEVDNQIWFLVDEQELKLVRAQAPEMLPAAGISYTQAPEAGTLLSQGYRIVNSEYGLSVERMRQYRQAGLWINIYTVDEPWQFGRLWLLGVDSTTTNQTGSFAALSRPWLAMGYIWYAALWAVTALLGMGLLWLPKLR